MKLRLCCGVVVLAACGDNLDVVPSVSFDAGPERVTREVTATFRFSSELATRFTCALDGAAPAGCESPYSLTTTDGMHALAVVAFSGDLRGAPAEYTWRVDTVAPETSITGGPSAVTNMTAATFALAGTEHGVRFECRVGTDGFAACTSPAAITVGDGAWTFEARAIDEAGNVDATPASASWTVDTVAPTVAITAGPDGNINIASATFEFVAGGAAMVECATDASAFAACTTPFQIGLLVDGMHTFAVRARDVAGNETTATRSFTVDTIAPVVTITGPGSPTAQASPTFAIATSSGGTQPIALRCRIDGAAFAACSSPFTTAVLPDGPHVLDVEAEDPATNVGTGTRAFTIDTDPPVVTIVAPFIPPRTSTLRPTIAFTATDAHTVVVECAIDGGAFAACASGFASAADLAEGPHVYHVRATDEAGTPATVDVPFVVDITPPDATITTMPPSPGANPIPEFAFVVGADAATVRCALDTGQIVDPCTSPVTFDAANGGPVAAGVRTFTLTVADDTVSPNTRTVTATFEIAICGDGARTGTEPCDGSDVGAATCQSVPPFDGGTLACTATCQLDTSQCSDCGNGVVEGTEECDGGNLAAASCASRGFATGMLGCKSSCAFDANACFAQASTGFTGRVCFDGVKYGNPGQGQSVFACTEDQGLKRLPLSGATQTWLSSNGAGTPAQIIDNLHGRGVFPQMDGPSVVYLSDATGSHNGFRSSNAYTANPTWSQATFAIETFTARLGTSTNNAVGGWSPTLGAVVLHGNYAPTATMSPVGAGIDGTVTSIAAAALGQSADVYVAVYGKKPDGSDATGGGIYFTCDQIGTAGGTYVARDTGIAPSDKPLVFALTVDPGSFVSVARPCPSNGTNPVGYATTYYAALRGGGQIYKTTDGGLSWVQKSSGLPAGAEVYMVAIDCFGVPAVACANRSLLWAATSAGLYKSLDAGDSWFLAGFDGEAVRAITLQSRGVSGNPPRLFVGVDDATGVYMNPAP